MDGSTDTFAGFEGGNLKNSSWYVFLKSLYGIVIFSIYSVICMLPHCLSTAPHSHGSHNFSSYLKGNWKKPNLRNDQHCRLNDDYYNNCAHCYRVRAFADRVVFRGANLQNGPYLNPFLLILARSFLVDHALISS